MSSSVQKSFKYLPLSLLAWIACFAVFRNSQSVIQFSNKSIATFVSAIVLVALSVFVVYGFSRLCLKREHYLAIGFVSIVSIYLIASPLVTRTQKIEKVCNSSKKLIEVTIASSGMQVEAKKLLPKTTFEFMSFIRKELKKELKEPTLFIIFLALAQLSLASGIGMWIGEGVDELSHLIPIALVATIADIWSVSAGATAAIIVSPTIHYFLLRFPILGMDTIAFLIGLTDFLFFTIFYQASVRYKLGTAKNTILLSSSFIIAIVAAIFFQKGLPVLPFMAALFVIGNWKNLTLKKQEMKQIALFLIVIVVMFAIITKLLH